MSTEVPVVSVVIPVYNGAKDLQTCIQSVIGQDLRGLEIEIIALDNASEDETWRIISEVTDSRFQAHRNPITLSPWENWTKVSLLARGKYIKLLPADDVLLPLCLVEQVAALETNGSAVFASSKRRVMTESGHFLPKFLGNKALSGFLPGEEAAAKAIRAGANIFGEPGAGLFRAEAFKKTLPWSKDYKFSIDLDFYLRILKVGDFVGIDDFHSAFRLSSGSWSNRLLGTQSKDLELLMQAHFENSFGLQVIKSKIRLRSAARWFINRCARIIDCSIKMRNLL